MSLDPLAQVLGRSSLTGKDWLVVLGLALVPAVVGQAIKTARTGWRSRGSTSSALHHG
ncbi:MAG: hypothetical protein ABI037_03770 [Gemmatimonadales bacterium]